MSYKYGPSIVTDGLVFYVDAGNDKSYPGSGTTWSDLIGGNDGTLTNGPTFDSANGGSIVFDGVNDRCVFSGDAIPTNGEITISFWRSGNASGYHSDLFAFTTGTWREVGIHTPWQTNIVLWQCGNNGTTGNYNFDEIGKTASSSEYEGWSNWTFTKNVSTGNMKIYLNGSLWHSGTGKTKNIAACNSLYIGSYGNSLFFSDKDYACFSIHNKELTPTEVLQNYNALKNRFI